MADTIIVGGGAAGCVLAARLSEDPARRVILLEAGPRDRNVMIHLPVGFFAMTDGPFTWGYRTTPSGGIGGRSAIYPQARVLGGGSSINAQVFTRGCPEDFDAWAREEGCTGWSHAEVEPYFLRAEGNDTFDGPHHSGEGPLGVSATVPHPLSRVFVRAAQQAGLPFRADFNAGEQAGAGFYQAHVRKGRRCSTATGYLRPAMGRANLSVRTGVLVERILIERGRATGVMIREGGRSVTLRADDEVIVCAGAVGSPKLLMLSGLGPADSLRALGIEVALDLPGVGRNLQDHFSVDVLAELTGAHSLDRYKTWRWKAAAGAEYLLFRKGPVASNIVEAGGFWWGDRSEPTPDLQFHFLPGAGVEAGIGGVPGGHGCTVNSYPTRPGSRGHVALASADPDQAPLIDPNPYDDPRDLERAADGILLCREILTQPAFAPFIRREHLPGEAVRTREDAKAFARAHGRSSYHPVGTCRMGAAEDEVAVVDPRLRVRGIEGLRICDSSVMPRLVSSNTNATTVMIAEKASDLIRC